MEEQQQIQSNHSIHSQSQSQSLLSSHSVHSSPSFSSRDYELMLLVLEFCAEALNHNEVPVACIIVHEKQNKILAKAYNQTNKTKNVIQILFFHH